ncbi:MAG: hypothetical protein ABJI43_10965 [Roseobacter sp.]
MSQVPEINPMLRYVDPETGRMTAEGLKFFAALIAATKENEARIVALEP